jgi:hypothetical protein
MIEVTADMWTELKRFISPPDRADAADIVVNLLVDHDISYENIKSAFAGDSDIKKAIGIHASMDDVEEVEDDEDDEDDDYEDDWEN